MRRGEGEAREGLRLMEGGEKKICTLASKSRKGEKKK